MNDDELSRRLSEALEPARREPPPGGVQALHAAIDAANLQASRAGRTAWLMPAAAAALVVIGGVAIAISRDGDDRPSPPATVSDGVPTIGSTESTESTQPSTTISTSTSSTSTSTTSTSTTSTSTITTSTLQVQVPSATRPPATVAADDEAADDDTDADDNSGPGGGGGDDDSGPGGVGSDDIESDDLESDDLGGGESE